MRGLYPGIGHVAQYRDLCLEPRLEQVKEVIQGKGLQGVVLTSCSPRLHQDLFRRVLASSGIRPHRVEITDLGTGEGDASRITTEEAVTILSGSLERLWAERAEPEGAAEIPRLTRQALVIGGGIAGIQAALDIADAGYPVVLVERSPSIGGRMIQLSEVFPTLDCPQCIMTPKMVEISHHPKVRLLTYTEVEEVSGSSDRFKVRLRRKARYVDEERCTGCGVCQAKCPWAIESEFEMGLARRKAIYTPFPQAVPNVPVIDTSICAYFQRGTCRACVRFCEAQAIDFEQKDRIEEVEAGAIVVATGYRLMPQQRVEEFAPDLDIIDGLQFERLLCPTGPTGGAPQRPSDGQVPREVVFVSCVGSRDPEHGVPYCSRVCCMYLAKMALLYRHAAPDGQAYVFYMDTRTTGKGYEEFVRRAVEEEGIVYLRGRVSRVYREGGRLRVQGADTLTGKRLDISCDLVVLGMAMVPSAGTKELARRLGILVDQHGFVVEADSKLRPMETTVPGIFVCGTAQGPRDIPDSVAQASGAAGKVLALFAQTPTLLERAVA